MVTRVNMKGCGVPDDVASGDIEIIGEHLQNVSLPSVVVAVAEDDIVRSHLHNGVELSIANEVVNGVGANEIATTVDECIVMHSRSRVDHRAAS